MSPLARRSEGYFIIVGGVKSTADKTLLRRTADHSVEHPSMVFAATNCGTLRGVTGSKMLQKTKKQTERAGTCPLFPLCAVLFQQIIASRVQRVAYSAQLHGLYVLYAAPLFYGNIIEKIAPPGKAEHPVHRSQKYTKNFCKNAEKSA